MPVMPRFTLIAMSLGPPETWTLLFMMMTSFASTLIVPVTSRASITVPATVIVMPVSGVSVVPGGTPVFAAVGLTLGSAGNVAQKSLARAASAPPS